MNANRSRQSQISIKHFLLKSLKEAAMTVRILILSCLFIAIAACSFLNPLMNNAQPAGTLPQESQTVYWNCLNPKEFQFNPVNHLLQPGQCVKSVLLNN